MLIPPLTLHPDGPTAPASTVPFMFDPTLLAKGGPGSAMQSARELKLLIVVGSATLWTVQDGSQNTFGACVPLSWHRPRAAGGSPAPLFGNPTAPFLDSFSLILDMYMSLRFFDALQRPDLQHGRRQGCTASGDSPRLTSTHADYRFLL